MAMLQDKLAAKLKEKQLAMKKHHKKVKKEYVGDEVERPKKHHKKQVAPAPTPATPVLWEEVIRCGQAELEEMRMEE